MADPSGEHMFFPPCAQSAVDTAPHGARANRGRTREASSAVRTKLSAGRPLMTETSVLASLYFFAQRAQGGAEISRVAFKS